MLKYLIAFCIISFCDSAPGQTRTYSELVLHQKFPVSLYFHINDGTPESVPYLEKHWAIFEAQEWVIDGLWAMDANGELLTNCVNSVGRPLKSTASLTDKLKQKLNLKWLSLTVDSTKEEYWASEYNAFGSCVTESETSYFEEALRLMKNYDLGPKLYAAGLRQDTEYTFTDMMRIIKKAAGPKVYVKCLQPPGSEKQYLLAIEQCFNRNHELYGCKYLQPKSYSQECDRNMLISYPALPQS